MTDQSNMKSVYQKIGLYEKRFSNISVKKTAKNGLLCGLENVFPDIFNLKS